jgi:hypothetical protein
MVISAKILNDPAWIVPMAPTLKEVKSWLQSFLVVAMVHGASVWSLVSLRL